MLKGRAGPSSNLLDTNLNKTQALKDWYHYPLFGIRVRVSPGLHETLPINPSIINQPFSQSGPFILYILSSWIYPN